MSDKGFFIVVILTLILIFILSMALIFREAITEYVKTRMLERQYKLREPLLNNLTKRNTDYRGLEQEI